MHTASGNLESRIANIAAIVGDAHARTNAGSAAADQHDPPCASRLRDRLDHRRPRSASQHVRTSVRTRENMLTTSLPGARSHESLIANESAQFEWPEFDERTAISLCCTSDTTGDPKDVLYSHPKWQERLLLVVVLKPGAAATREEILDVFAGKVAKWWIPPAHCQRCGERDLLILDEQKRMASVERLLRTSGFGVLHRLRCVDTPVPCDRDTLIAIR
jgi:acyl-CoA synthetase (AMP-forming)/AMP-acid ligase II